MRCLRFKLELIRTAARVVPLLFLFLPPVNLCFGQGAASGSLRPATNWELIGRTVVIDPGHGGADPGAVGYGGTLEKDVALAVSKKLKIFFQQAGAKVVLTREKDQELGDPDNPTKVEDLRKRLQIAHEAKADLLISIHLNHFSDRSEYGAQVFYQRGSAEGKKIAEQIQPQLNAFLIDSGRQALAGDFYLCRNARIPAVIVEVGFLSHPEEERKLQEDGYQGRAAWAIYRGVVNYFRAQ
ncbi:MAG: N-acetylmuramoyl-L-alanine amidase [Bacillota bacterium]